MYYAHVNEKGDKQTVQEHVENVARITGEFSNKFGAKETGRVCGQLHDVGKCSSEFQCRLLQNGPKIDHATAGAKEASKIFGRLYERILGYIICGHHSGLPDFGTMESGLLQRLNKDIPKYYADDITEKAKISSNILINEIPQNTSRNRGFTIGFYIRMIYSSLVDADFLDTEEFNDCERKIQRGNYKKFGELETYFNDYMKKKNVESKKSSINIYRKQIYDNCIDAAFQRTNLFTLTVPTGGGKTLSSMAFALNHLKFNYLERIICVIPYTSIIEQNANVYKGIWGQDSVLEHHSNFDFSEVTDTENMKDIEKLKYASENWDVPIIVTTNVQFFESLFANRSSMCRKLHNITNSVVIIDEAQMMPTKFLTPTIAALKELVNNYNTSVVLTTATKPKFPSAILEGTGVEIIKNPDELYNALKRTKVEYINELSDEGLATMIEELDKVLIIVNTRNHAQNIYDRLDKSEKDSLFHLSAKMCPEHRNIILSRIKDRLKLGEKCKVISTQLIECGVDISFPVVYRSLTGIDSIAQSAGRCNREGELDIGKVYVFKSTETYGKPVMYQSRTADFGRQVLERYEDPLSLDAISKYFDLLYDMERDKLDSKNIMDNFEEKASNLEFAFATTAREYKLIEEGETLIIPYNDEACKLIEGLRYSEFPNSFMRKLQKYTISIHSNQLKKLQEEGGVIIIHDIFYVLSTKEGFYDENTGLVLGRQEVLIC
ncbi:CRISPR-associated helicase Cas3' [Clostridium sp.]|uniref:CRISPR-associated helicase Cas3' n=1 Tax=Clostridium sp. TaxID=1506 RepID=UPI0032168983